MKAWTDDLLATLCALFLGFVVVLFAAALS